MYLYTHIYVDISIYMTLLFGAVVHFPMPETPVPTVPALSLSQQCVLLYAYICLYVYTYGIPLQLYNSLYI